MSQVSEPERALRTFISENRLLNQIEAQVGVPRTFNIFEAIGATRQELRHSDFLAFLLDPQQTHGLDDAFLRALLDTSVVDQSGMRVLPADVNLTATVVRREWQNIDILLINAPHRLVVIIENKIDSLEHSDQLRRYYALVQDNFPGWSTVALYLTPDETQASDPRFQAIGYSPICMLVEQVLQDRTTAVELPVRIALQQYVQMLRRHVVADSDSGLARLARQAYREHEQAIDAIVRYREQRQRMIRDYFEELVRSASKDVMLDQGHVDGHLYFSRFVAVEWYDYPELRVATTWTKSRLVLLFQFIHSPQSIGMDLAIGSGPTAAPMRERLYALGRDHQPPFTLWGDLSWKHFGIFGRTILVPETRFFENYTDGQIKGTIREHWEEFHAHQLPRIRSLIRQYVLDQ